MAAAAADAAPAHWVVCEGGLCEIGHAGSGFAFDNESPCHRQWLAAGWDWVRAQRIAAPLHWRRAPGGAWQQLTLHGLQPLQAQAPVAPVSLYEADADARWQFSGVRLACDA